jgi:hypothetical protein
LGQWRRGIDVDRPPNLRFVALFDFAFSLNMSPKLLCGKLFTVKEIWRRTLVRNAVLVGLSKHRIWLV